MSLPFSVSFFKFHFPIPSGAYVPCCQIRHAIFPEKCSLHLANIAISECSSGLPELISRYHLLPTATSGHTIFRTVARGILSVAVPQCDLLSEYDDDYYLVHLGRSMPQVWIAAIGVKFIHTRRYLFFLFALKHFPSQAPSYKQSRSSS